MDAKPQRPVRVRQDENAVHLTNAATKILHQRHKSTPALPNIMQAVALKAGGQKRAAMADVSNFRGGPHSKDDSAIAGKGEGGKLKGITVYVPDALVKEPALARKPLRSNTVKNNTSLPSQISTTASTTASVATATGPLEAITEAQMTKQQAPIRAVAPKRTVTLKEEDLLSLDLGPKEPEVVPVEVDTSVIAPLQTKSAVSQASQAATILKDIVAPSAASSVSNMVAEGQVAQSHPTLNPAFHPQLYGLPTTAESDTQAAISFMLGHEYADQQAQLQQPTNMHTSRTVPLRSSGYPDSAYEDQSYADYTSRRSLGDTTGGASILLALKYTDKSRAEIAAAKLVVEASRTPEEEEDDQWDTSMVAEYGEEIFEYFHDLEERMMPNPHYMDHQTECQWSMRSVLLDWLVQVHARFTLLPETLFLSVNFIDRFLSCKVVSLAKLQLVGATALFLAAKYEEVNCPSISEIVYMVDNGYSVDEILKAERFMLSMLAFELGWPGPMSFLRRISKADDYDLETRTLAKYFLEVTIMDERFVGVPPSATSAAAHCLARQMLRKGDWTQAHVYYSNYTYAQLCPILQTMLECCEDPVKHHGAVYTKYQDKRYKKASHFVQAEMRNGFKVEPVQTKPTASYGASDFFSSAGSYPNAAFGIPLVGH